jgi:hypothetical protein
MKTFTKDEIISKLTEISKMGWIPNARYGNSGGVGNTLEDLLGIDENNLPIPNASEWELKCQRLPTRSLLTLTHLEPSPRAIKFVSSTLLPKYGWRHNKAGIQLPENEMSFRATINALTRTDRGFKLEIDRKNEKILVSFDSREVQSKHLSWLNQIKQSVGNANELEPQPYWGFEDLNHKIGTKLLNCFYVQAQVKREKGVEWFNYSKVMMLKTFNFEGLLKEFEQGNALIDFDARSGHNHGTKFRLRPNSFPNLYKEVVEIIG